MRKSDILILNVAYFAISTYHCGCVKWFCAVVVGVPQGIVAIQLRFSHARAYALVRAPSNGDVVFLLSQVSHTEKKLVEKRLNSAL